MQIYLVRHGEAAAHWHEADDPGLSEYGRQQAADTARELLDHIGPGIRLLSSPMLRTRETAAPLASALGAEIGITGPFREIPTPVPRPERQRWLGTIASQTWSEQVDLVRNWRDDLLAELWRVGLVLSGGNVDAGVYRTALASAD